MDSVVDRTHRYLQKSIAALEAALMLPELPERADRDAVLLRFELAVELTPKVLQRVLRERGAETVLPKDSVRVARSAGIIGEEVAVVLLSVIDDRNRMVHDYSEEYATALIGRVKNEYAPALRALLDGLKRL